MLQSRGLKRVGHDFTTEQQHKNEKEDNFFLNLNRVCPSFQSELFLELESIFMFL